ncbi:glycosyltransferase family 1 protein (plasmid) [Pantoea sp. Aalb]|nr:glycosyltransferase family 1 protein [Pantoea sp. Aalb]
MNDLNNHNLQSSSDYSLLLPFGIHTVRESIGWRLAETNIDETFKIINSKMQAAKKYGIQILWSFCHYGWPKDLSLFSPNFIPRFAMFCKNVATYLADYYDESPIYSPINEISFMSWGISTGLFGNDTQHHPDEIKRQLIRATIAGCDSILSVDPRVLFLHCDPIIQVFADNESKLCHQRTVAINESQFEAWDMITGVREPQLGGKRRYLDIIGANYYHNNQWFTLSKRPLDWHLGDSRRFPLHKMLSNLSKRYKQPILIAETSHVGSGRSAWLSHITAHIAQAQLNGCDIRGICIYPIIDRPLWDNIKHWPNSGLWDVDSYFIRILNPTYATTLKQSQSILTNFQTFIQYDKKQKELVMKPLVLLVFSHLRWNFVFQRPQHIMSRLAQYYRIFFIEEPIFQVGEPCLLQYQPTSNITVVKPCTHIKAPGFHDDQINILKSLLINLITNNEKLLIWFYTPMALPLIDCFQSKAIIYDCMDELSAFRSAPPQLQHRELTLLKYADIIFTGGTSLYESKKHYNSNIYCFPSSVDVAHFEQALDRNNDHPLQKKIPKFRLGYYGVIDERMDMLLLEAIAKAHPDWQLIMVGPIIKIDVNNLPHMNNIHWFGQQPYEALPHFLAGWDVCLIPFLNNNSTHFISPTKILEYMAAQIPIVSTAIPDVSRHYSDIVNITFSKKSFIEACNRALKLTTKERKKLAIKMSKIVANTSWDHTVAQMQNHIYELCHINKNF